LIFKQFKKKLENLKGVELLNSGKNAKPYAERIVNKQNNGVSHTIQYEKKQQLTTTKTILFNLAI
jgi:hypothetical protein